MGNNASINVASAAVAWGCAGIVGIAAIIMFVLRERALSKAFHRLHELSEYYKQQTKTVYARNILMAGTKLMELMGADSNGFVETVVSVARSNNFEDQIADAVGYLSYQVPAAVVRGVGNTMLFVLGGGFIGALTTATVWALLWGDLGYTTRADGVDAYWLLWGGFGVVYACIVCCCLFMTHVYTSGSKLMLTLFVTLMAGAVGFSLLGASLISVQTTPVASQYSWLLWGLAVLFQLTVMYVGWCALGAHSLIDPPTKELGIHVKFNAYNYIRGAALAAWLIATVALVCFALSPENTQTSTQAAAIDYLSVQIWMSVEYSAIIIIPLAILLFAAQNYYEWTTYMWKHRLGVPKESKVN